MWNLFKIAAILVVELNFYHFLGIFMEKIRILPLSKTFASKMIYGFVAYHSMFWCVALPCRLLEQSLHRLTSIWVVFVIIILIAGMAISYKEIIASYYKLIGDIWKYKWYILPCILLMMFLLYYICTNGQNDIDAQTYIGQVTTVLDMDRLTGINIKTGAASKWFETKRIFSVIEYNSAMLCQIFHMHPLLFCRTVRGALNGILLAIGLFLMFLRIYQNQTEATEKAIMTLMLAMSSLFLFHNTIYTGAHFLLFRAYEGKAYCANTFITLTILSIMGLYQERQRRYFILLFLTMLAGLSFSPSSAFVLTVLGGCLLAGYILIERKWNYILYMALAVMPNIIYILLNMGGFPGLHLEG